MSWASSLFVAILTAAVGLFVTGFLATLMASWYRVPNFEAQSAAYVVSIAIFGMVGGFIIGIIASRVLAGGSDPSFLKALGASNGVLLAILLIIGVTAHTLADVPPKIDGEYLMLMVELRWPQSRKESPVSTTDEPTPLQLGSITRMSRTQRVSSTGVLWTSDAHLVDGRWVAPGAVDIFTTRGKLSVVALFDTSTNNPGFILPMSGTPRRQDMQWSEWMPRPRPGAPPLPDGFQIRYRVQKRSEPVRTETVGPFEVQTIASYFYNETIDNKTVLATRGRFRIRHGGQTVEVDGHTAETHASDEKLEQSDGVAVIPGTPPALFAHFVDASGTGPCYVVADASGEVGTTWVPNCIQADGSLLTSDSAEFRKSQRRIPQGRINHIAFETPGIYNVGGSVFDTRTLAVHQYDFPDEFSIVPSVPPLGISPDGRSVVRFGSRYNRETNESPSSLAVADFVGKRAYILPVDETRMRYATLDAIDPAWLAHHFEWQRGSDGADSLVERKGFVPIPYHGRFATTNGFWLEPGTARLRDAIIDLLVTEYKGERVSVEDYAYEHPVKIDGQTINVAYGDTGHYVSISLPDGATDTTLFHTITRRIDAVLATGKYDSLFGK